MKCNFTRFVALILMPLSALQAAGPGAGGDASDRKAHSNAVITVEVGGLPIILSAPHGGRAALPGVEARKGEGVSKFNPRADSNTDLLTEKLADALEKKLGKRPYVVIARFHRKYLDVNRRPEEAFESTEAKATYDAYHAALAAASKEVTARWGRGIVLDIHGQGSKTGVVFRGTQSGKTVSHLLKRSGRAAMSGETSLVGQMAQQGFTVAPPVGSSDPETKYNGGYIVGTHGSSSGGTIDAIQLEFGPDHRAAKVLDEMADKLARAIMAFAKSHLPTEEQKAVAGEEPKGTAKIAVGVYIDKGAVLSHDIVVYGDSSGAVIAAIAAKREGRSVIWLNPTGFSGGMSASGLGATDFLGRRDTFGGIASEFYDGVAIAYKTNYVRSFEPHVGKQVFEQMLAAAGVTVVYNEKLDRTSGKGVTLEGKRIKSITMLSGKTYSAKMFVDATYVGDLMAAAGVTYTVGREPESQYGENMAGVRRGDTNPRVHYRQKDKDHFIKDVDPYVKPGDPSSGLLPHIHKIEGLKNGQGDKKIQAFNYRVCLTTNPENRIPLEKPAGYREIDHELLLRNFDAGDLRLPALIEPLAGGQKVDWNNMHAVGSDFPGANWEYPEASYERRREIEQAHETYIRGFLWTMANHPRVPEEIRKRTAAYGLPKDEFTDNAGWPWMIYIREARRMVGDYVMTQLDCEGKRAAPDPVGLGSFGMDSHVVQHFVTERGFCVSDGVIWRVPPKPYGISYRSITPKKGECENLFSPICLSASHVAHGSIRMEPVFMALSQSAAIAAGLAIDKKVSVQEVPYPALLERLEAAKQIVRLEARTKARSPKK